MLTVPVRDTLIDRTRSGVGNYVIYFTTLVPTELMKPGPFRLWDLRLGTRTTPYLPVVRPFPKVLSRSVFESPVPTTFWFETRDFYHSTRSRHRWNSWRSRSNLSYRVTRPHVLPYGQSSGPQNRDCVWSVHGFLSGDYRFSESKERCFIPSITVPPSDTRFTDSTRVKGDFLWVVHWGTGTGFDSPRTLFRRMDTRPVLRPPSWHTPYGHW